MSRSLQMFRGFSERKTNGKNHTFLDFYHTSDFKSLHSIMVTSDDSGTIYPGFKFKLQLSGCMTWGKP